MSAPNCYRCGTLKTPENTHPNQGGLHTYCKLCRSLKSQEKNRENQSKKLVNGLRPARTCKICKKSEPDVEFRMKKPYVGRFPRALCVGCNSTYTGKRMPGKDERDSAAVRRKRSDYSTPEAYIKGTKRLISEYQKSDIRKGYGPPDLPLHQTNTLLNKGCTYCTARRLEHRIGLDRLDNSLGHSLSNVVACCQRCNLIKGNMPIEAWLSLVEAVRVTFKLGLFGDWVPGNRPLSVKSTRT